VGARLSEPSGRNGRLAKWLDTRDLIPCGREAVTEIRISEQRKGRQAADTSRGSSHLKLLEDLTVFLTRTEDYQEALEGVVRLVAGALDCEVCSLYSYDPESHKLRLAATIGLPCGLRSLLRD